VPDHTRDRDGRPPRGWRRNPAVRARLSAVERMRSEGLSQESIARALGVNPDTINTDYRRLDALALEYLGESASKLRADKYSQLEHLARLAVTAYHEERAWLQACLFGTPIRVQCPGRAQHRDGTRCIQPHDYEVYPVPGATLRSQSGTLLATARQARFDQARLLGLVVDKHALTDNDGNDVGGILRRVFSGEPAPAPPPDDLADDEGPPALPPPTNGRANGAAH